MSCRELYDSSQICCSEMRQAAEMYSFLCVLRSQVLTASEIIQLCRLANLQSILTL